MFGEHCDCPQRVTVGAGCTVQEKRLNRMEISGVVESCHGELRSPRHDGSNELIREMRQESVL